MLKYETKVTIKMTLKLLQFETINKFWIDLKNNNLSAFKL